MPSTAAAADGSQGAGAGAAARPRQAAVLEDSDDDSPQAEPGAESVDVPMPDASQVCGTAASGYMAFARCLATPPLWPCCAIKFQASRHTLHIPLLQGSVSLQDAATGDAAAGDDLNDLFDSGDDT